MKTKSSWTILALLLSLIVPLAIVGCERKGELEIGAEQDGADLAAGLPDAGITAKVMTQLARDERVRDFDVEVETRAGIVILKGAVGEKDARDAAEELARVTEGVSRVVNKITVGSGESSAT